MSLSNLKEELRRKTELAAAGIEAEGKEEAKRVLEEAHRQAKRIHEAAVAEASDVAAKERTQVSAARLKARRLVQDARFALAAEAIGELRKLLEAAPERKREYQKLLESLIESGMDQAGKDCTLLVRKEDAPFAKKFADVGPALQTMGGVVVVSSDGRVKINSTFEALLEEADEKVKQKAFELLFK